LSQKKIIDWQGRKVEAEVLEFEAKAENWNQYVLEDGTTLKMKVVLLDVARTNEYNEQGDPIYVIQAHQIVGTSVPANLKRKSQ